MSKYNVFNFNRDTSHVRIYPDNHFDDSQHGAQGKSHKHHKDGAHHLQHYKGVLGHETRRKFLAHFERHSRMSERRARGVSEIEDPYVGANAV